MFADEQLSVTVVVGLAGTLLVSVSGALIVIFKLLMTAKEAQIAELKEQTASFKKGFERAVDSLEVEATKKQQAMGQVSIPIVQQTKAEHNSPTTDRQQFASDIESLKARQAAAELALKELPMVEPLPDKVNVAEISPSAARAIKDAVSSSSIEASQESEE